MDLTCDGLNMSRIASSGCNFAHECSSISDKNQKRSQLDSRCADVIDFSALLWHFSYLWKVRTSWCAIGIVIFLSHLSFCWLWWRLFPSLVFIFNALNFVSTYTPIFFLSLSVLVKRIKTMYSCSNLSTWNKRLCFHSWFYNCSGIIESGQFLRKGSATDPVGERKKKVS